MDQNDAGGPNPHLGRRSGGYGQFDGGQAALPGSPSRRGGGAGSPELRIKDQREKHVLREAVAGLLPERLYHREKFAFMAPPAHADEEKLQKLDQLVAAHLSREAIETSGLLDPEGVAQLLTRHRNPETPAAEKVQLDAMVNHLLGVQILHKLFVQTDVPAQARQAADARGWHVSEPAQVF